MMHVCFSPLRQKSKNLLVEYQATAAPPAKPMSVLLVEVVTTIAVIPSSIVNTYWMVPY
jgi:hypothetical protein